MALVVRSRSPLKRACVTLAGLAALATACRRPAPTLTGEAETESDGRRLMIDDRADAAPPPKVASPTRDGAAAPVNDGVPMLGWANPARLVTFPAYAPTTREAFLRAHGVTNDRRDAICFLSGVPECLCSCAGSFAVTTTTATVDVLVCTKGEDSPHAVDLAEGGTRTVLYAVDKGAPKVLLSVLTRATFNPEDSAGALVGNVELHVTPSADGVTLVDAYETDDGPWCPQALAKAATQDGPDWAALRRHYAAVCSAAGRYVLKDGRLVKIRGRRQRRHRQQERRRCVPRSRSRRRRPRH